MFSYTFKSLFQTTPRYIRALHVTSFNCESQLPKEKLECQVVSLPASSIPKQSPERQIQECPLEISKEQPKVLIVGAGVAGLSAAKRLTQIGFHNFKVLEATGRPGGRIDSHWVGDVTADLGAPWTEDLDIIPPSQLNQAAEQDQAKIPLEPKPVQLATDCIPPGYVGGVTPLLNGLPASSVLYEKPVDTIRWNETNEENLRALVKCADGDEFLANFVIVTVSLGYLKLNVERMFEPALTPDKINAIKDLGFDVVDKIFLEYETPFKEWHSGEHLCYYWDPDEMASEKDWAKGIRVIEKCDNSKRVLHAIVAGSDAITMEKASDAEVADVLTRVLAKVSSNPKVPLPKSLVRSCWGTNPYFCGAHSYMDRDSKMINQIRLADSLPPHNQPTPPVLLFAGEATSPGHFGTVQGARISGIREAERVGHLTRKLAEGLKTDNK